MDILKSFTVISFTILNFMPVVIEAVLHLCSWFFLIITSCKYAIVHSIFYYRSVWEEIRRCTVVLNSILPYLPTYYSRLVLCTNVLIDVSGELFSSRLFCMFYFRFLMVICYRIALLLVKRVYLRFLCFSFVFHSIFYFRFF